MSEQRKEGWLRREAARVLVTGGAGFLGSHLVRALVAAGHAVRVLDDFSTGRRERLDGLTLDLVAADVRSEGAVRRALEGMQVVFHLAGTAAPLVSRGDLRRAEDINVGGALNVLEAASEAEAGIRRIVLVSSGAVYGQPSVRVLREDTPVLPVTPEGVQALAVERYATMFHRARGISTVTLRLFQCFGPGEDWEGEEPSLVPTLCRAALAGRAPRISGDGRQIRNFLYIDNVVGGLLAAACARGVDGRIYNLGAGESVSVASVWEQIARHASMAGLLPIAETMPLPSHEPLEMRACIDRAGTDLGFLPAVALGEGLRRTVAWYRDLQRTSRNDWFTPPEPEILRAFPPTRPSPPPPPSSTPTPTSTITMIGRRNPPPLPARAQPVLARASAVSTGKPGSATTALSHSIDGSDGGDETIETIETVETIETNELDIEFEWSPETPRVAG